MAILELFFAVWLLVNICSCCYWFIYRHVLILKMVTGLWSDMVTNWRVFSLSNIYTVISIVHIIATVHKRLKKNLCLQYYFFSVNFFCLRFFSFKVIFLVSTWFNLCDPMLILEIPPLFQVRVPKFCFRCTRITYFLATDFFCIYLQ